MLPGAAVSHFCVCASKIFDEQRRQKPKSYSQERQIKPTACPCLKFNARLIRQLLSSLLILNSAGRSLFITQLYSDGLFVNFYICVDPAMMLRTKPNTNTVINNIQQGYISFLSNDQTYKKTKSTPTNFMQFVITKKKIYVYEESRN